MISEIPPHFADKIRSILKVETDDFFNALLLAPFAGFRINPLKTTTEKFCEMMGNFKPVPWCETGFYYDATERLSKNPLYHAGLYYLQEPSAMLPVNILNPQKGDFVLDICAAPGGKSTQIAGHLHNTGLLVSNDFSYTRSKALAKNLTLCGAENTVILSETPEKLAGRFPIFFDKILVDAPCSGEGMLRKSQNALKLQTAKRSSEYILLQKEILHHASSMLKPGGFLVYSTCTFNMEENEEMIADFLAKNSDFEPVPIDVDRFGVSRGFDGYSARIFPHRQDGEGHFACLVRKKISSSDSVFSQINPQNLHISKPAKTLFNDFCKEHLQNYKHGNLTQHKNSIFAVPTGLPNLTGLRIVRIGLYLGEIKKDRFEPSHALALSLNAEKAKISVDLNPDDCLRYLRGETIVAITQTDLAKPWVIVCLNSFPLGWARLVGGRLKNKYPQGWI
ncbi:MAG: RsmF rRNA methyltransferase first C-terminal domain-containing protein [Turicibacter sp.]|nr:RsmF rRNA methyltransferase first C-terminal domain-containing protein [Turicibacter sp.]